MMPSGNSKQLKVIRTGAWEMQQQPDGTRLVHNCHSQESELYTVGNKESLNGNDRVGFVFRNLSLDNFSFYKEKMD